MKKIFLLLERYFEPVCIVTLITLMTAIICLQIVLRLFDASLSGAEEIARFLFVWAMYLSISYAIRDDRHIRITFLVDKLPDTGRTLAYNCADLVFLGYSVIVVFFGYRVISRSLELGQIAPATEMPVAVLYGSVLIGCILNVIRIVMRLRQRVLRVETHSAQQQPGP
ncbi:MAG: TRAP transporter small permease [Proteobacteria bacterium]|nr:TRAP transporter small permease [Pseudomonadota bacterium]